ncbi:MAG: helix-hairpin-helix domain-containing protein [Dehalococcoidales bacterium]|nr:helix-hairpin-helix domain-containing protein [Dehalococcoidales bacterium]
MKNSEIARVFQVIASLLEAKGENQFKIRAYRMVSRSIKRLLVELEQLVNEDRLKEVPGVGDAIAGKIIEMTTTGHLDYYERLKAEFPEGMIALLSVPGIGPKTAMRILQELDIKSIDELELAVTEGRLASLPRIGRKTIEDINRHLKELKRQGRCISG